MNFALVSRSLRRIVAAFAAMIFAGLVSSRAQTEMFLKVGDISGPTLDSRHPGESEVLSWSWGAGRTVSSPVGGGRTASKPTLSDLSITKQMDSASPAFMKACVLGTRMKDAVLTLRTGGDHVVEYCRVVLQDVTVVSINEGAGSEGAPIESLELNFLRVGIQYISIVTGAPGPVSSFGYDLTTDALASLAFPPVLPPYDRDSDGDGMPDWWELQYGLDPNIPNGDADADQDGATNLEEFLAGTNPKDATQVFRAELSFRAGDRTATLTWQSLEGRQYNVLATGELGTAFQNLMTVPANGPTTSIPVTADLAKKFFRVQIVPAQ